MVDKKRIQGTQKIAPLIPALNSPIFRNFEESKTLQCVYYLRPRPLVIKALTTFVILACLGIRVGLL